MNKPKPKKVVVAGHACLDITPVFSKETKGIVPGDLLLPGKLIEMEGADIHAGGAVSNTGIAMKLLGNDVTLLTKTGEDDFGLILKDIYEKHDAAEGVIAAAGERTSYSVVLAIPGVDRIFLHDPGCNHTFSAEDVKKADLTDVALFHFGYPPLMKRFYADEGEELLQMMRYLKEKGIATSLDMAAVDPSSEAGRADWDKILQKTLPYVDFFVPSVEELCFMLDKERFAEWSKRAAGDDMVQVLTYEDIRPLAEKCISYGAKVVLIKCGAPGLFYATAGKDELQKLGETIHGDVVDWADRQGFVNSYIPEKVLSGTGAGDTTIAAFLTAVLQGYDLSMCVELAAAEGASCVEDYGALGGIKPLAVLEEKIRNGWKKGAGLKK